MVQRLFRIGTYVYMDMLWDQLRAANPSDAKQITRYHAALWGHPFTPTWHVVTHMLLPNLTTEKRDS